MASKGDLVLLTGATGYIGFRALRYLLDDGFKVRVVARSAAKAEKLRSQPTLKNINQDNLTFVTVADFAPPNAFDEALQGVKALVHIASPIPGPNLTDLENDFVRPAVDSTLNLLNSAEKTPSIKRVVITSSVVAIAPPQDIWVATSPTKYTPESRLPEISGPVSSPLPLSPRLSRHCSLTQLSMQYPDPMIAYTASKIAALNATDAWISTHKPHFSVTHILPAIVLGHADLVTSTADLLGEGTNKFLLDVLLSKPDAEANASAVMPNAVVHVDDVARAHVDALAPSVESDRLYILQSPDVKKDWSDLQEIVARRFPKEVQSGVIPNGGRRGVVDFKIDVSDTEKVGGFAKPGFEELVVEVVEQYLELKGKEEKV